MELIYYFIYKDDSNKLIPISTEIDEIEHFFLCLFLVFYFFGCPKKKKSDFWQDTCDLTIVRDWLDGWVWKILTHTQTHASTNTHVHCAFCPFVWWLFVWMTIFLLLFFCKFAHLANHRSIWAIHNSYFDAKQKVQIILKSSFVKLTLLILLL